MLKLLINAYAMCPNMGSEQGMAWNWVSNIAKYCECFVITEGEYRKQNDAAIRSLPYGGNIHVYYIDVTPEVREMCWNQGTWSFYYYYRKWQVKALNVARDLVEKYEIDVMHQLNMVGFREPGMLYKINRERNKQNKKSIPIVWGPSAGYGSIPISFLYKGGLKFTAFYLLKNLLNVLQLKFHKRVKAMVRDSSKLIAATPDMQRGFADFYHVDAELISEVGCCLSVEADDKKFFSTVGPLKLVWVGRFIYTKQLELALQVIQCYRNVELHIVGEGFTADITENMHQVAKDLGVDDLCVWHGKIPNQEVHTLMKNSDLFFFTSIFEATSTVILEAISNKLPIVCFDCCGFGAIVDDSIGRKVACINPKQAVLDFAREIKFLSEHRELLPKMSEACRKKQILLSWNTKINRMVSIYRQLSDNN